MKEENKYYQPSIEEFCVGFEFEERYLDWKDKWSGWSKRTINNLINLDTFNRFIHKDFKYYEDIKEYEFRVKYLDSQDIIDCGFVGVKTYSDELLFQKNISAFEFIELTLHLDEDYNITIEKYCQSKLVNTVLEVTPDNYENYIIFRGTIKNKHELQTILKQIGVL